MTKSHSAGKVPITERRAFRAQLQRRRSSNGSDFKRSLSSFLFSSGSFGSVKRICVIFFVYSAREMFLKLNSIPFSAIPAMSRSSAPKVRASFLRFCPPSSLESFSGSIIMMPLKFRIKCRSSCFLEEKPSILFEMRLLRRERVFLLKDLNLKENQEIRSVL